MQAVVQAQQMELHQVTISLLTIVGETPSTKFAFCYIRPNNSMPPTPHHTKVVVGTLGVLQVVMVVVTYPLLQVMLHLHLRATLNLHHRPLQEEVAIPLPLLLLPLVVRHKSNTLLIGSFFRFDSTPQLTLLPTISAIGRRMGTTSTRPNSRLGWRNKRNRQNSITHSNKLKLKVLILDTILQ